MIVVNHLFSLSLSPTSLDKINQLQANLIRRFRDLVESAAVEREDRVVTAVKQYQIQTETGALVWAFSLPSFGPLFPPPSNSSGNIKENFQTMIR